MGHGTVEIAGFFQLRLHCTVILNSLSVFTLAMPYGYIEGVTQQRYYRPY